MLPEAVLYVCIVYMCLRPSQVQYRTTKYEEVSTRDHRDLHARHLLAEPLRRIVLPAFNIQKLDLAKHLLLELTLVGFHLRREARNGRGKNAHGQQTGIGRVVDSDRCSRNSALQPVSQVLPYPTQLKELTGI